MVKLMTSPRVNHQVNPKIGRRTLSEGMAKARDTSRIRARQRRARIYIYGGCELCFIGSSFNVLFFFRSFFCKSSLFISIFLCISVFFLRGPFIDSEMGGMLFQRIYYIASHITHHTSYIITFNTRSATGSGYRFNKFCKGQKKRGMKPNATCFEHRRRAETSPAQPSPALPSVVAGVNGNVLLLERISRPDDDDIMHTPGRRLQQRVRLGAKCQE